ncbi:MAG: hypothetical protein Q8R58_03295 [Sulfuricurvum sp.]|nr:hypothetical protein [Sulfuricurvum sp.]
MLTKTIVLILMSSFIGYTAECKFPNPCGQMLIHHEAIAASSPLKGQIDSNKYSENAVNLAWEKLFHQVTFGGKRLNTEVPDGMPVGDVFFNTEGLLVETNVVILSFDLIYKNTRIWTLNPPRNSFIIPSNILKVGEEYSWEATIKNGVDQYTLKDDFTLMNSSDQKTIQIERKRIVRESGDPTSSEFLFAVYCYDYGYRYNGDIILQKLNKEKIK